MSLINDNFMIGSPTGVTLYQQVARDLPIIDYHCHLEAKDIYENRRFSSITELWLAGDHYKWRAMRANGIPEAKITGNAFPEEKFQAWAETVEAAFGNPLYHWTHLELKHYFGIDEMLSSRNWRDIMDACNRQLQDDAFTPRALMMRSRVEVICTTDSPLDSLHYHQLLKQDASFTPKVLPTFRPDEFFSHDRHQFSSALVRLAELTGETITRFTDFERALEARVQFFHEVGCRISDHGLGDLTFTPFTTLQGDAVFQKKMQSEVITAAEESIWQSVLFITLARLYKKYDWAMQIHFGAIRNNNQRMLEKVGVNSGFDAIADQPRLAANLNAFLNAMAEENHLPRTIIYNLYAAYNDIVASTIANFQSGEEGVKSPLQFGSGWWFNDTRRGMLSQLNALADQGLLMNFVGMLTDSRSFVSYPRHDYFRRILCGLIGQWIDAGEFPADDIILQRMVRNICHDNALHYFKF
ncbi:glucuronate isomerase [Symbiopectobacterium purcellii]|uniref:Uronate isomerase n=1 Tax=Symbiopectobacterium purcellii TaxID=2871826 RepID=A0ABX9AKW5_9ENTR|nr:glucuronate isomerase [Symbiopectobacterium purcellii]QZN95403.1 glucuronate isomerase [Symbiopectobacterium purcellii]